jgi:[NiFe] hydrogenase diaphorase moiety large subunit
MSRDLSAILARHQHDPLRLVQILRDVVEEHGFVSPGVITTLAERLSLPRGRVEGVAGFYAFFPTENPGRYRVLFSDNITDRMAGSVELRQRMLEAFQVREGEVSRDGLVSIGTTSCTGLCDQGPAMLVNGRAIPRLTRARIGSISAMIHGQAPLDTWPANLFDIHTHIERKDLLLATPLAPGAAIDAALARGPDATVAEVKASNLRGRGGAGFTTGVKWEMCRAAPGEAHYVVCNADEGEPGTFKDRVLLSDYADLVFEGMTVAAFAVGAKRGFLYLRAEYPFLLAPLEATLAERRKQGLLGNGIRGVAGFDFDIEIHVGAGAYVCGEESALIESLEGKRGIPRNRPPYPVTSGYLQQPTVVNNVETLAKAAFVVMHGADWLRVRGTGRSAGTKVLSVSGDVPRPGIYELPFGATVREVLELCGATNVQAVQVGGPSGMLLSRSEQNRRIMFEDVPSAGAFMVFDDSRDILQVLENFATFFAHESCGFCTPCRVGTALQRRMLSALAKGYGTRRDVKDLARVAKVMKASSHCGLGATAGNAALDALEKFKPAFEKRLGTLEVMPTFDLDRSLAPAREVTGRDDDEAHLSHEEEE